MTKDVLMKSQVKNKTAPTEANKEGTTTVPKNTITNPVDLITDGYADILVNQMLNATESTNVMSARSKLNFYDHKLKGMGLRATIRVGTEKI